MSKMFQAVSKKQMKALTWWKNPKLNDCFDALICDGAIRSGKTVFMFLSYVLWAMGSYDKQQFGICGKTVQSCRRNVTTPLIPVLKGLGLHVKESISEKYLDIDFNGNQNRFYIFGGKDESSASLIQGITLAGIFFDEVVLQPKSFVEQGMGRCSVAGSKYWFNCNPDTPTHWFYTDWILKANAKRALYLHFTQEDNPSLSEKIKERYRLNYSGVFYQRFIEGKWVKAEGLVYSMFDDKQNLITTTLPSSGRFYVSVDYGTVNPTSFGLWQIYDGKFYRIKEYYYNSRDEGNKGERKTDEEYYQDLVDFIGNKTIQSIIIDPSAASFRELIQKEGRFSTLKGDNHVIDGIRLTASFIKQNKIFIDPSCTAFLKEIKLYSWDEKATEDAVIKENDHAMDDMRYFINTVARWE